MINQLNVLFSVLMGYRHNIHMLHWKVVGTDFDCVHKLMDDYLDTFNGFIDDIGEMLLTMGHNPLTLQECMDILTNSDTHVLVIESGEDYTPDEVFKAIEIMFNDLYMVYDGISCEASDCSSKLDEHKYWLRVEGKYKNVKRMKK